MSTARAPVIILIGNDTSLVYLLERYAERSGCKIRVHPLVPTSLSDRDGKPAALLFSSIEDLEAAQVQLAHLSGVEVPLLVCSSINDQARARDLGVDHCLVHPLTYDGFLAVLKAAHVSLVDQPG